MTREVNVVLVYVNGGVNAMSECKLYIPRLYIYLYFHLKS